MEEHNHKIRLHQDDFDNNGRKVKGKKERETRLGEGGGNKKNQLEVG